MKRLLLLIICTLFHFTSYGQGFGDGIIITKQSDTIKCQVELAVTYSSRISYKKNGSEKVLSIPSKDVNSLTTPYNYFENITLGKKERLMRLQVKGEVNLYQHYTINPGASQPAVGGRMVMYNAPTIIYAIKKGETYYEVKSKSFTEIIGQLLNKCQSIIEKVNSKEYKIEDMEKIVKEYNSCR